MIMLRVMKRALDIGDKSEHKRFPIYELMITDEAQVQ
jgi:hypothetical protein